MNAKERLLAVYRNEQPDRVPVHPCFAYLLPMRRSGMPFNRFTGDFSKHVLDTYRHYGADARVWLPIWGGNPAVRQESHAEDLPDGTQVIAWSAESKLGRLTGRTKTFPDAAPGPLECPIKDLRRDLPILFEQLPAPEHFTSEHAPAVYEMIGCDGIAMWSPPAQFLGWLASAREGGITQAVYDLVDDEGFLAGWFEQYLDWYLRVVEHVLGTAAPWIDVVMPNCGTISINTMGLKLYRRWDMPFIRRQAEIVHRCRKPLHVHQHGHCLAILDDLVDAGVNMICPFERPPGGDVASLAAVRRRFGRRIGIMGNVHTIDVLLRGTPGDVRRQVRECIDDAAGGPFVLSTGDQVADLTPDENIRAFCEAGREFGNKP